MISERRTGSVAEQYQLLEEEIARNLELVNFGELTISSVTYGPTVDNNYLVSKVEELRDSTSALTSDEAREFIEGTGMTVRRHSFNVDTPNEEVVETSAKIGAEQIRALIAEKGWSGIDLFIDTSASLSTEAGKQALERAGLDPSKVEQRSYRTACSGAISAFIDVLAEPQLNSKRVVICALEPLSRHISDEHFQSRDGLSIPAIFGDDFAAIAFKSEDFELVAQNSLIAFDGGTLRFKTTYDLPENNPELLPPHYTFGAQGEEIFSMSGEGVFIKIQEPLGNLPSEMDGRATARFFIRHTVNVIQQVVAQAEGKLDAPLQAFGHQPSKDINKGFQNLLAKKVEGVSIPDFLLGEIQRSNCSSATPLVIWQHLAREGLIDANKPILPYAPGIGSVISAGVVRAR